MSVSMGFYTAAEAARISKVPRSTVDYWARTQLILPSHRLARPRLYSFQDLRDLVVAQQLRSQGAAIRDVRAALGYVRSVDDVQSLAAASFWVSEGQLVYENPEKKLPPVAPHRRGQVLFLVDMRKVFKSLGSDLGDVARLRPVRRVLIDPSVRGGTPVIEGTRIPTAWVAQLARDGVSTEEIIKLYPSLKTRDVESAIAWEESLERRAARQKPA